MQININRSKLLKSLAFIAAITASSVGSWFYSSEVTTNKVVDSIGNYCYNVGGVLKDAKGRTFGCGPVHFGNEQEQRKDLT